jgi:deoxyribonuclease-4
VWKAPSYSPDTLAEFARRVRENKRIAATVCHASYLVNLGTADGELLGKSLDCLSRNLVIATQIGSDGLVLHLGSHLGQGLDAVMPTVVDSLLHALDEAAEALGRPSCPILLENTAGAGGTIGRSFAELGRVIAAAGDDERLGLCLDTQHLFASGTAFDTLEEADAVVREIDAELGLSRLQCIHLNDSKVPFGANRDRHENLGEGFIGRRALGSLLGHPRLQGVPAVLEVPGVDRAGPGASDVETARAIHRAGRRRWQARR